MIKITLAPIFLFLLVLFACRTPPVDGETSREVPESPIEAEAEPEPEEEPEPVIELPMVGTELPVSVFGEIWGYLIAGEESDLKKGMPVSDVGYFGAQIDFYGKLVDVPNRRNVPATVFSGRVHLVVVCNSSSLTHFVLLPGSVERKTLIADLLAAARNYDGLQIDFESVPKQDGGPFLSFLEELRTGLGTRTLTVALPARIKKIANDVYDYERIKPVVDRILVMAYDEHWSTSAPGPIASMPWCRRVAAYALSAIGREKLIMGIPFYGRTWGDVNPNRAFFHSGIMRIMREQGVSEIRRENGIPTFTYRTELSVTAYFEDDYSLAARMEMYKSMGVAAVGFWRLGQETRGVWNVVELEKL